MMPKPRIVYLKFFIPFLFGFILLPGFFSSCQERSNRQPKQKPVLSVRSGWKSGDTAHFYFGYTEASSIGGYPQVEGEIRIDGQIRILQSDSESLQCHIQYGKPDITDRLSPLAHNPMARIWLRMKENLQVDFQYSWRTKTFEVIHTDSLLAQIRRTYAAIKPDTSLPSIPPLTYIESRIQNQSYLRDHLFREFAVYFDHYLGDVVTDTSSLPKTRGLCLLTYPELMSTVLFTRKDSASGQWKISMRQQLTNPERKRLADSLGKISGGDAIPAAAEFFVNTDFGFDAQSGRITGMIHDEGYRVSNPDSRTTHRFFLTLTH